MTCLAGLAVILLFSFFSLNFDFKKWNIGLDMLSWCTKWGVSYWWQRSKFQKPGDYLQSKWIRLCRWVLLIALGKGHILWRPWETIRLYNLCRLVCYLLLKILTCSYISISTFKNVLAYFLTNHEKLFVTQFTNFLNKMGKKIKLTIFWLSGFFKEIFRILKPMLYICTQSKKYIPQVCWLCKSLFRVCDSEQLWRWSVGQAHAREGEQRSLWSRHRLSSSITNEEAQN